MGVTVGVDVERRLAAGSRAAVGVVGQAVAVLVDVVDVADFRRSWIDRAVRVVAVAVVRDASRDRRARLHSRRSRRAVGVGVGVDVVVHAVDGLAVGVGLAITVVVHAVVGAVLHGGRVDRGASVVAVGVVGHAAGNLRAALRRRAGAVAVAVAVRVVAHAVDRLAVGIRLAVAVVVRAVVGAILGGARVYGAARVVAVRVVRHAAGDRGAALRRRARTVAVAVAVHVVVGAVDRLGVRVRLAVAVVVRAVVGAVLDGARVDGGARVVAVPVVRHAVRDGRAAGHAKSKRRAVSVVVKVYVVSRAVDRLGIRGRDAIAIVVHAVVGAVLDGARIHRRAGIVAVGAVRDAARNRRARLRPRACAVAIGVGVDVVVHIVAVRNAAAADTRRGLERIVRATVGRDGQLVVLDLARLDGARGRGAAVGARVVGAHTEAREGRAHGRSRRNGDGEVRRARRDGLRVHHPLAAVVEVAVGVPVEPGAQKAAGVLDAHRHGDGRAGDPIRRDRHAVLVVGVVAVVKTRRCAVQEAAVGVDAGTEADAADRVRGVAVGHGRVADVGVVGLEQEGCGHRAVDQRCDPTRQTQSVKAPGRRSTVAEVDTVGGPVGLVVDVPAGRVVVAAGVRDRASHEGHVASRQGEARGIAAETDHQLAVARLIGCLARVVGSGSETCVARRAAGDLGRRGGVANEPCRRLLHVLEHHRSQRRFIASIGRSRHIGQRDGDGTGGGAAE